MKVSRVCCQGCGADLRIDDAIRFVTCNYCHAQLEVVHDDTVTHTKRLDHLERTTHQIAGNLKVIELQNDVEQLDREWEKFRNTVLVKDENGRVSEPTAIGAIVGGIVGIVVGILFTVVSVSNKTPAFALVGLSCIGIAIFFMRNGTEKAEVFRIQRYRYETTRKSLLRRIDSERASRDISACGAADALAP